MTDPLVADQRVAERQLRAALDALEHRAAELASANARLADLAATVTHDLLQPVAALDGFLRLLQTEARELSDEHKVWLDRAITSKDRLTETIRALHRHAVAEELTLVPVDLAAVLQGQLAELTVLHPEVEVAVGKMPIVLADPGFLQQVVANLVENSVRYRSPERPLHVTIGAERHRDRWELIVTDTGLGIDRAELDSVFERGFRGAAARGTRGSGLGLATVRSLVARMGGVVVARAHPGGACVCISLREAPTEHW
jgi:signal transduction histidine kinase